VSNSAQSLTLASAYFDQKAGPPPSDDRAYWRAVSIKPARTRRRLFSCLTNLENTKMQLSTESLLVILFVGLVAGWAAGQIMRGTGFGIVGDVIVGILGAFIGSWLLPQLSIHLGSGLVSAIINATIGAIILLLIIGLVRGAGLQRTWGGRSWGRR
jgi:uncharacterized membrane protein YeaQ/YmgE (transglycosylase-associated protein family)